ncbi:MAG: type II toxin-antitoxin system RelE/ParE family toxin [Flavobacteriales bacterium]|nr:type II toxin-antitoxin system RelE/ParE family toxin [Flavobacteriales bacterium]
MELKVTEYAVAHLVESVELTLGSASLEKREEMVDRVLEEAKRLIQWPNAGQVEVWMEGREHVYRRLVVGNFKVIYRVDDEVIYVTDIFDARQDPSKMRG